MSRRVAECRLNAMCLIAGVGNEIQITAFQFAVDEPDSWSPGRKNDIGSKIGCESSSELFLIRNKVPRGVARVEQALRDLPDLPTFGLCLQDSGRGSRQAMRGNDNPSVPRILFNLPVGRER